MTEMKTGAIPLTGRITLESTVDQWQMFANGLLRDFSSTAVIVVDNLLNKKVKINLKFLRISPPGHLETHLQKLTVHNEKAENIDGIKRCQIFLSKEMDDSAWTLLGYINGKKRIPIIIFYYKIFDYAVYSVVIGEEETKKFFPSGTASGLN